MAKAYFKEKQRFRRWDIIALIGFLMAALTYRFIETNFITNTANPLAVGEFLFFAIPLTMGLAYCFMAKASVRVTEKALTFKSFPFHRKKHKIAWQDVEEVELVRTPALAAWSGWNINYDHEKRFGLARNYGVHLKTKQGEQIFVGANKVKELETAVKKALAETA